MASSLRSFAAALLFVMLFMATELGRNTIMVAEALPCEMQSGKYKGACVTADCAGHCHTEGFLDGHCKGQRNKSKCICIIKRC
nr:defensin-like protein [Ipomoea batatas]